MYLKVWCTLLLLCCSGIYAKNFATFFEYSDEELGTLSEIKTGWMLSKDEMRKWDATAAFTLLQKGVDFYDRVRIFAYLYVAQADFAFLTHNLTGNFNGSLDPLSHQLISYFLPDYSPPKMVIEDPYSKALAEIVLKKVFHRIETENGKTEMFVVPEKLQKHFSAGLQVAKWNPWFAKPSKEFWPPEPPAANSPIWKEQAKLIVQTQEPLTESKKRAVYRWAGLGYPWSDDWRTLANNYLWCQETPLLKCLQVRSMLNIALYDCVAAYATCKYQHLAARPKIVDPSILYVIPVPQHPTYPAGHASESACAFKMLSFFFPEYTHRWRAMAEECALSRIWAGIHFPIDNKAGNICGTKVAEKEIEVFTQANPQD